MRFLFEYGDFIIVYKQYCDELVGLYWEFDLVSALCQFMSTWKLAYPISKIVAARAGLKPASFAPQAQELYYFADW